MQTIGFAKTLQYLQAAYIYSLASSSHKKIKNQLLATNLDITYVQVHSQKLAFYMTKGVGTFSISDGIESTILGRIMH